MVELTPEPSGPFLGETQSLGVQLEAAESSKHLHL